MFLRNHGLKNDLYSLKPNFRWDSQSEFIYKTALLSDDIANQINIVLQSNETDMDVDEMLSKVETILSSAAKLALKCQATGENCMAHCALKTTQVSSF